MLIEGELVLEYASHIDVRVVNIPETILARAKCADLNLTSEHFVVVSIASVFEGVFNVGNDLVSEKEIFFGNTLFLVDHANKPLDFKNLLEPLLVLEVDLVLRLDLIETILLL